MIDTTAGSLILIWPPTQRGLLEAHIVVRSPIDLRGHAPLQKMEPALPSGADIATALFTRPAAIKDAGANADPTASLL